jgi:hypothetical protein
VEVWEEIRDYLTVETADLLGTTRRTGARMDEIADDDGKLLSTGSRVQI